MSQNTLTQVGVRQWNIDPSHSEVAFSVRHMMISTVRGNFTSFSGVAEFDPEAIEQGSISVEIDVASIDTRDEQRDGHLRSADFLDAETYPHLTFKSTSVEPKGNGEYFVHGDLTIRNVSRPVTLNAAFTEVVPDPFGGTRIGVSANTEIDRKEFDLTWNQALETGGVLVGENVGITINAQLVISE
jgi:polyisoprenoid-binding protein YceI